MAGFFHFRRRNASLAWAGFVDCTPTAEPHNIRSVVSSAVGARGHRLGVALAAAALAPCVYTPPALSQSKPPDPSYAAERGQSPEDAFAKNSLSLVIVSRDPTSTASDDTSPWRPVRGKYRWAMSYGDFYTAVGRPDLAASQNRRDVTSGLLVWGGLAVTIGGIFLVVHGLGAGDGFSTESGVGVGLMVGGGVAYLLGASMDETVISAGEAQELAASYNDALRARLGVPADSESSRLRAPSPLRLRLALLPRFWTVSLSGGF